MKGSLKTKIEIVPIASIKINTDNPRLIKDGKYKKLVQSIKDFPEMLDIRPIVINKDNIIIGGNQRYQAAKEAKLKQIPIIKADHLTEDQEKEFVIKDNASSGEWDWDILANEWDADQLSEWGMDVPGWEQEKQLEAKEDEFDVPQGGIETDIVLGDLFEIGDHRLLCGDSTDNDAVEKVTNNIYPDIVFTDPPYNIDYQGVKNKMAKIANDKMSDDDFVQFLYDALNINCDTFYVCCSWQYSHLFRKALEDLQKPVKSFIVWDKINPAQHLDKYFKQHEIILYHGKFGGEETVRGDVWQTKRERNTVHPTMKPIGLIEMALNDHPNKRVVYDAFLGSGSTMVAAHQLKRKCYGMELDPKYCQVIVERMLKLDPSLTVKRNGVEWTPKTTE